MGDSALFAHSLGVRERENVAKGTHGGRKIRMKLLESVLHFWRVAGKTWQFYRFFANTVVVLIARGLPFCVVGNLVLRAFDMKSSFLVFDTNKSVRKCPERTGKKEELSDRAVIFLRPLSGSPTHLTTTTNRARAIAIIRYARYRPPKLNLSLLFSISHMLNSQLYAPQS